MLTGRPPFKGTRRWTTVKQVLEVEPISPSRVQYRVPRDLETICLKCLQKEPRKRYATAKEMADDLNRYLVGEPIRARRTPLVERGIKWTKRHPAYALASAFTVLVLMTLSGSGAWYWNQKTALERIAQQHEATLQKRRPTISSVPRKPFREVTSIGATRSWPCARACSKPNPKRAPSSRSSTIEPSSSSRSSTRR